MTIHRDNVEEREVLEVLRDRYVSDGFQFIMHPSRSLTPSFLGDHEPDAVALKGRGGVIIEIRGHETEGSRRKAAELARLVGTHPGWSLEVIFASNFVGDSRFPRAEMEPVPKDELRRMRMEVAALLAGDHVDAALMMAWALLEAVGRTALAARHQDARKPLTGWQVVERLASDGLIDFERSERLRRLLLRRNALSHGIPTEHVEREDVTYLLDIVDDVLAGEPA